MLLFLKESELAPVLRLVGVEHWILKDSLRCGALHGLVLLIDDWSCYYFAFGLLYDLRVTEVGRGGFEDGLASAHLAVVRIHEVEGGALMDI